MASAITTSIRTTLSMKASRSSRSKPWRENISTPTRWSLRPLNLQNKGPMPGSYHRSRALLLCLLLFGLPLFAARAASPEHPKPVILDTDIGDDIDDTWALGLLLQSPELDLKLVMGDYGKVDYRARLLAKFLQTVHRTDVPIGIGVDVAPHGDGPQLEWITNFTLPNYSGQVYHDGVGVLIEKI